MFKTKAQGNAIHLFHIKKCTTRYDSTSIKFEYSYVFQQNDRLLFRDQSQNLVQ